MDGKLKIDSALAVDGGDPTRTDPMPPWPKFEEEEILAVAEVLRSGRTNYHVGRQGRAFEAEFAAAAGCRHGVAVANGTVALELALQAVGIGPGDEVILTGRSFIASASCCVMRGAIPVFADVDPQSQNVTAESIRAVLSPRTKAIIAVHLAGWPCEMDPILELAARHELQVIEDCAQAHGATYRGRPVGSLGHVAAFSFCQDKILSTGGEGGMMTTNDRDVWQWAWGFKDHGKSWDVVHSKDHATVFRWLHESFGTNWRMTEMQSVIGRVIVGKLPDWVARRRQHAALLDERFARVPQLRVTVPPEHIGHAYYKYYVFLRNEMLRTGWTRDRVVRAVQAEGIPCGSGICPAIYREKAFDGTTFRPEHPLPVAEELGETSLMLQVHPTLEREDILDTARAVEKVIRAATVEVPVPMRRAA
ncbi:MAG: DegT/DnrJ/EryC1/StrS aminotransferase family protein [Candidatus Nealsonbacteria bacterium]|nr:DegT/DnrJ/EryC1/StrS aminotransferase family protein [Candidatus Nealsonbacteria bacterium]